MAVPKRKTSNSKKNMRRSHLGLKDINVILDVVPYDAIMNTLPIQLAAGEGPDIARVTDLGGLNKYYAD